MEWRDLLEGDGLVAAEEALALGLGVVQGQDEGAGNVTNIGNTKDGLGRHSTWERISEER